MAKKNTLNLELSGFNELVTKLEGMNGNVHKVVTDALMQAAETIEEDTHNAVKKSNLPAKGKYSTGDTEKAIAKPSVTWSGTVAEVGVGFDYSKNGAGGFLITGTPRMQPDRELQKMYKQKKYMKAIQQDMEEVVQDEISRVMEGK